MVTSNVGRVRLLRTFRLSRAKPVSKPMNEVQQELHSPSFGKRKKEVIYGKQNISST